MLSLTAALVLSALHPSTPVTTAALGQKIQIIKGKKGSGTVKNTSPEGSNAAAAANAAKEQDLNRKAAELDARHKQVEQREQALQEKQAAQAEDEKKQAEQRARQQKMIEKIGEQNQQLLQQASDGLAGD
jgi:hypothetical protein